MRGFTLLVVLVCGCSEQHGLVLDVRARPGASPMETYDLRIKDIAAREVVIGRLGERIEAGRDISLAGEELKLAIALPDAGNYLVHLLARPAGTGATRQFTLFDIAVDGLEKREVLLFLLLEDLDSDGLPACGPPTWLNCGPVSCQFLDCDDRDGAVHPFAEERCGNGRDDDCSAGCGAPPGAGDEACEDADGDGVPANLDCDDNDPCRSPRIPEYRDMCGHPAAAWDTPDTKACRDSLAVAGKVFAPPLCGDDLDNNCDQKVESCFVDGDCDGYTAPADCDDTDAQVSPAADEECDGKDNNCNGATDEGCLPCDADGDLHALKGTSDPACTLPADDPDDYDAGIHPDTTRDDGGKEGGTVNGALRGVCGTAAEKDGKSARDVDHDGDGLPASSDGCPPTSCDGDGDGFEGSQCSPPASMLDCNDNDPEVFPGAPERCGDGVAQGCVADTDCSCDGDGDGYCPPPQPNPAAIAGDCKDDDASIHPWALEVCDGTDNDCDGLTDEGNPGADGVPIPTDKKQCNDDADGKCAPLEGVCVCSPVVPNGTRDGANRTACTGEDLGKPASPRCFGAPQPGLERCDLEDWNCDGNPYVTGETFVGLGAACGSDTGRCAAGLVEKCDPSGTAAPEVIDVLGAAYEAGWVCSTDTVLPSVEECNGWDDDCDGHLSPPAGNDAGWVEVNESDADGDGYLACNGCDPKQLAGGIVGCGDCDDGSATVYPGAPELCNGVDDNCKGGTSDDGSGQCSAGMTCCAQQKACRDLQTDLKNCGACGKGCPPASADACIAGTCTCGGAECAAGECEDATCTLGVCVVADSPPETPCQGGLCYNGSCCQGCWDGKNSCKPGNLDKVCGSGGADCADCTLQGQVCIGQSCAAP